MSGKRNIPLALLWGKFSRENLDFNERKKEHTLGPTFGKISLGKKTSMSGKKKIPLALLWETFLLGKKDFNERKRKRTLGPTLGKISLGEKRLQ